MSPQKYFPKLVDFSKTGELILYILILFENKVVLLLSSRNRAHLHGNVLKSHGFYRFLWQRNGEHFIFIFLSGCFLTNSSRTGSKILMSRISQTSKIKSTTENFWVIRNLFILADTVIIWIHFGSRQLPVSLKITTAVSMFRKTLVFTQKIWASYQ